MSADESNLIDGLDYIYLDPAGPEESEAWNEDVDETLALPHWNCGSTTVLGVLNNVDKDEVVFDHNTIHMHNFKEMSSFLDKNGFPNYVIQNATISDLEAGKSIIQIKEGSICASGYCLSSLNHFLVFKGEKKDLETGKTVVMVNDLLEGDYTYNKDVFLEKFTGYAIIPQNKDVTKDKIITNPDKQSEITGNAKSSKNTLFDSYKESNPKIKELATKITNGAQNNQEKVRAIYDWCRSKHQIPPS